MLERLLKLINRHEAPRQSPMPLTCLPFDNKEKAESFFFEELRKDLNRVKALEMGFPALRLDYTPASLTRLEKFFFQNFVLKSHEIGISRPGMEELITLYVRHLLIYHGPATWCTSNCDTNPGYYRFGVSFSTGEKCFKLFGWELGGKPYSPDHSHLLGEYLRCLSQNETA